MRKSILISTSTFAEDDPALLARLKKEQLEVTLNPFKRKLTKTESLDLLAGKIGLIAGLETLDEEVLSKSSLKVISRCGTGMSNVDLKAAKRLKIKVLNTPDAPTEAVAELTLGCLLNLLRNISSMDAALHQKQWKKTSGYQLKGKTVLIVGLGRIGQRFAELLKPFDVNILAVDPYIKKAPPSIQLGSLKDCLSKADIISLHCSGEDCVLGKKELALVKQGSFILNASRGKLIDETTLIEALKNNKVAGAWLDTFEEEPYTGALTQFSQVLLTPHVGSYTKECRRQMEMEAVNNLIEALKDVRS